MLCIRYLTSFVTVFDPTGLSNIARAFMYNQCDS